VFDEDAKRFHPRLVAVQTGYYGLGHAWKVVGTHWGAVRAVICRAMPGLIESAEQILVPS
jgi:hypothetical protein